MNRSSLTAWCFRRLLGVLRLLPIAVGLVLSGHSAPAAKEEVPTVDIAVRASVDRSWNGVRKQAAVEHGKRYVLASVQAAPTDGKVFRPLDEVGLVRHLRQELNARGFIEITTKDKAEIILTVVYGRGNLENPYRDGVNATPPVGMGEEAGGASMVSITSTKPLFNRMQAGYEAKLQRADLEKLFIRVTAYQFPSAPKEKPKQLWKTTMVVDNPDERDLNNLYRQMLATGAGYFDKEIEQEEIESAKPLPEGQVDVGIPTVVEPPKAKK